MFAGALLSSHPRTEQVFTPLNARMQVGAAAGPGCREEADMGRHRSVQGVGEWGNVWLCRGHRMTSFIADQAAEPWERACVSCPP